MVTCAVYRDTSINIGAGVDIRNSTNSNIVIRIDEGNNTGTSISANTGASKGKYNMLHRHWYTTTGIGIYIDIKVDNGTGFGDSTNIDVCTSADQTRE
jgi:hypothetical protein